MSAPQPPPTWSLRIVLLAASMLAAVILVGWAAVGSFADRPVGPSLQVGKAVYTVTNVEQLTGLTEADLGGMSHGIQGLVTNKQMLIRVSLTVSASGSGARFDPSVLEVYGADGVGIAPLAGSLSSGQLGAHGRMDGSLSYIITRGGGRLRLRAGTNGASVPLLPTGQARTQ